MAIPCKDGGTVQFREADLSSPARANINRRCVTTTFGDIVTAVSTFAADYDVYIVAGLVLGAGAWLVRKLVKAGR